MSTTANYFEQDGVGSVTSLSEPSGALATSYSYDSFGKLIAASGTVTNPYQYTGRNSDSEDALDYYRARYYDPSSGRFLSEDPFRSLSGLNRYKYVSNHPLIFNDPLGLTETCTPDGETQLTPWLPYSTTAVPITGWTLPPNGAGETGGPDEDSGVAAATLYCVWTRMVSETQQSGALFEVYWVCVEKLPCGFINKIHKFAFQWHTRSSMSMDFETTTTRFFVMGVDSDFWDWYQCQKGPHPQP